MSEPEAQSHRLDEHARRRRRLFVRILPLLFLPPLVLLVYVLVKKAAAPSAEPAIVEDGATRIIQLDVLNGAGQPRLAQRLTDYLRSRGFDVVELGNFSRADIEETLVYDRAGNLKAAQQVAAALGLPPERAVEKLDTTLYLDVTVVIGKDFHRLKPFQE
jgi:hypothetical protein